MRRHLSRLIWPILVCLLLASCAPSAAPSPLNFGEGQATGDFFLQYMLTDEGGVLTRYAQPDSGVLSESQGLLMQLALLLDDQALFDKAWNYVQKQMYTDGRILWRVGTPEKTSVSALVDDLRIVDALLTAGERWQKDYAQDALTISGQLYKDCVQDGLPVDFYDAQLSLSASRVTLCYLDLPTLNRLSALDDQWQAPAQNAAALLKGGALPGPLPLYYTYYEPQSGLYACDGDINMIEALLSALHARRAGIGREETVRWLAQRLSADQDLYAYYDAATGEPATDMRSSAVYALAYVLLREAGEPAAETAKQRMAALRTDEPGSPLHGAHGDYSFDNLLALWAYLQ